VINLEKCASLGQGWRKVRLTVGNGPHDAAQVAAADAFEHIPSASAQTLGTFAHSDQPEPFVSLENIPKLEAVIVDLE
jgi:hypothetical protein